MRKLALCLILAAYFISFIFMNSAAALGPVSKIEITHAHAHEGSHEHHHHDSHEEDHDPKKSSEPHSQVPHSHEIVVGSSFLLAPGEIVAVVGSSVIKDEVYLILSEILYQSPSLFSIFRPPIQS